MKKIDEMAKSTGDTSEIDSLRQQLKQKDSTSAEKDRLLNEKTNELKQKSEILVTKERATSDIEAKISEKDGNCKTKSELEEAKRIQVLVWIVQWI